MKNSIILLMYLCFTLLTMQSCKEKDEDGDPIDQSAKSITSFTIESLDYNINIDQANKSIFFKVPANVNLAQITPTIKLSNGAHIAPPSGQTINLTAEVTYTVTATDGSTQPYTVSAEKVSDTAFVIIDMQNGAFDIDEINF